MAVGVHAHVVLQVLRQVAPFQLIQVFEQRFGHPDHDREQGQQNQLVFRIGDAEARHKRVLAIDYDVDRDADQDFRQHVEKLVEDGVDRRDNDVGTVLASVAEQAS